MPLPAALQARLQKRGLIQREPEEKPEEEVTIVEEKVEEPKIVKKNYRQTPLPPGWFKVPDSQTKREYYWNVHTNQVSWRHPIDPEAKITYPASWQQKKDKKDSHTGGVITEEKENDEDISNSNNTKIDQDKKEDKGKPRVKTGKHPSLLKAQRQKEKSAPYRKKFSKGEDVLDPMDPASYSDVGRGTWSSGLQEDGDQKTGVDTTASGPLFQQRPYPSPGDILRRNKKIQDKNKVDDDDDDD